MASPRPMTDGYEVLDQDEDGWYVERGDGERDRLTVAEAEEVQREEFGDA